MSSGRRSIVRLALLLGLTAGCAPSTYSLATVSGVVTLDGVPLANAVVNFQPMATGESTDAGPGSTGRCDANGRYVLVTIDDQPGAVVGKHRVRIYSYSPESPMVSDTDDGSQPQERVPDVYNYRSQLTFVVEAAGTEDADFALDGNATSAGSDRGAS